jgi:hypothetical protein
MYEPPKMKAERQEGDPWLASFMDAYSERHASILGFVVGYALGIQGLVLIIVVALAVSGVGSVRNKKAVRELRKEPWYGIGSAFLGYTLHLLVWHQVLAGVI